MGGIFVNSPIVERLFKALDMECDNIIHSYEYITALSIMAKGTTKEQLNCIKKTKIFSYSFQLHSNLLILVEEVTPHKMSIPLFWVKSSKS